MVRNCNSQKFIDLLEQSSQDIMAVVTPLSDESFLKKPAPASWSIGEILTHLTLVDKGIFARIKDAEKHAPQKIPFLKRILPIHLITQMRLKKFKAPKHVDPAGAGSRSRKEIVEEYKTSRAAIVLYYKNNAQTLEKLTPMHPIFGILSTEGILKFLYGHERRHLAQMKEVLGGTRAARP
jgi:hypothetical protein